MGIFDDPPANGTPAAQAVTPVAAQATPAGTPNVVVVTAAQPVTTPKRKTNLNLGWALVLLVGGILALGSLGFMYPLSNFIDPLFGILGKFVVVIVAKANSVNLGYMLILWTLLVGNLAYMAGRSK